MTTQDSSALDEKEAERLASMIRPAWEVEEDDDVDAAADAAIPATAKSADGEASAIAAKLATDPGAPPARDTVIDGSPTIGVGPTDPGPPPEAPAAGAPKKIVDPAPKPAGPTKLGMGDDVAEGLAQVDAARAKSSAKSTMQGVAPPSQPPPTPEPSAEVTEALAVGPSLKNLRSTDVIEAPPVSSKRAGKTTGGSRPLTPVKPQPASFSKADDPVELPQKSSNATLIIVGLVAAVAAIAGGVMLFGGDDPKPAAKPTATATTEAKPTNAATSKPVETAAQTAAPPPTVAPEPTVTASASATASATATATATAVAKVDPPKPEVTNKPPPPKPTATGGGKPPPKGGGGIIRDTPF